MVRAIITWVVTPLLALALLPSFVALVRAVHQDAVFDWLSTTGWPVKAGYGLLLVLVFTGVALRRRPFNRWWLAERPFVRFWSRLLNQGETSMAFRHEGLLWRIDARPPGSPARPGSPVPTFSIAGPHCPRCERPTDATSAGVERCPACGFARTTPGREAVLARLRVLAERGWEMVLRERQRRSR